MTAPPLTPEQEAAERYPDDEPRRMRDGSWLGGHKRKAFIDGHASGYAKAKVERAAVIEECAKVAEGYIGFLQATCRTTTETAQAAREIAETLRALAAPADAGRALFVTQTGTYNPVRAGRAPADAGKGG